MRHNNSLTEAKLTATALLAWVTARLGTLALPVYILVALGVTDYITGLVAAPYRGERRSSAKGYRGIAKKVCILLVVALGAAVDSLLAYTASTVGIVLPFRFLVASAVTIWLICNEMVSILENIGDIGAPLPGFLTALVKWIQQSTEQKITIGERGPADGTETDSTN